MSRRPVSTRCDAEIWESARAAAAGMQRREPTYSLSRLIEDAIATEVARLSDEFNAGQDWPPAPELRRGRRLGDIPSI